MPDRPPSAPRWTLVQHSGAGYAGKPGFARAVETRQVTSASAQAAVAKAGGVLLDSYSRAADAEETVNYPPDVAGLYPRTRGTFAELRVDGLQVYRPAHDDLVALGLVKEPA